MMRTDPRPVAQDRYHAVRFYDDDDSLCRIVAEFFSEGLAAGQPAMAVATPAHRAGIRRELGLRALDVNGLTRRGELKLFDAEHTLSQFMTNNAIDAGAFRERMGVFLESVTRTRSDCTVRVYGQMVDLLWRGGLHASAVRLEMLWNQLADVRRFSLLCSYSMGYFHKDAAFDAVRPQHTHVMSPADDAGAIGVAQATIR